MRCEQAVSSVVGTVLILAITVSTFGGVAFFVMQEVESAGSAPHVDLHVESANGQFVVKHRGGDALRAADVTVHIYDGVTRHDHALTEFPVGDTWEIGESLVISDVFAGVATGIELVANRNGSSDLLAAAGTSASGPPQDPADLLVSGVTTSPLIEGTPVTFQARLQNLGGAAPGSVVRFEVLDGSTVVWTTSRSTSLLQSGAARTITSPAWTPGAGTFTLRTTADASGGVAESDETNNAWLSGAFTPAAAGAVGVGFVDIDADAAFTPGHDLQFQAGLLSATDCLGRTCAADDLGHIATGAGYGLYLLPSTLTTTAAIYFEAPGDVSIEGDLTGSGGVKILSTGGNIAFTGTATASNNHADVVVDAAQELVFAGASLRSASSQGEIQLLAGGSIWAAGASTASAATTFTAAASGSIDQSDLSLLDRTGTAAGTGTITNAATCVTGTLASGAWTTTPPVCA